MLFLDTQRNANQVLFEGRAFSSFSARAYNYARKTYFKKPSWFSPHPILCVRPHERVRQSGVEIDDGLNVMLTEPSPYVL